MRPVTQLSVTLYLTSTHIIHAPNIRALPMPCAVPANLWSISCVMLQISVSTAVECHVLHHVVDLPAPLSTRLGHDSQLCPRVNEGLHRHAVHAAVNVQHGCRHKALWIEHDRFFKIVEYVLHANVLLHFAPFVLVRLVFEINLLVEQQYFI